MKLLLNVLAIGGGMIGSVMVASATPVSAWGYVLFLMSSVTSSVLLWNDKELRGLLALNIFYIGVNVFGLARWFNWI